MKPELPSSAADSSADSPAAKPASPECCRWKDKFTPATGEDLLQGLGEHRAAAEQVRAALLSDPEVTEGVSWEGVAWRWCFVYSRPGDKTRAWAYLIPNPEGPRLCVPLAAGAVEQIRPRRLKKGTRDALSHGQVVNGVRWLTLALGGAGAGVGVVAAGMEEIEEILRAKRECGG